MKIPAEYKVYKVDTNMIQKQNEVYDHYGFDKQLEKLEEECLELALAIKHKDRPSSNDFKNLIEEMADVENLLEQIKNNNKYIAEGIKCYKQYKVDRQINRISSEE